MKLTGNNILELGEYKNSVNTGGSPGLENIPASIRIEKTNKPYSGLCQVWSIGWIIDLKFLDNKFLFNNRDGVENV